MKHVVFCLVALFVVPAFAAAPEEAAVAPKKGAVAAKMEKPHFAVVVRAADASVGAEANAQVSLLAKGGYKFNKAYPTKVKLSSAAPALTWGKALLKKGDGAIDDSGARFKAAYTSKAAGKSPVEAQVSFSVCNDQTCKMIKEKVSWELVAK